MTYKFTLDADDDKFDAALKQSVKLFADIEPDCEIIL